MTKEFRIQVLEETSIAALTKHFTVNELNAMVTFYSTPEGQSILKKFGRYTAEIMPSIQQEVMRAVHSVQPSLK